MEPLLKSTSPSVDAFLRRIFQVEYAISGPAGRTPLSQPAHRLSHVELQAGQTALVVAAVTGNLDDVKYLATLSDVNAGETVRMRF